MFHFYASATLTMTVIAAAILYWRRDYRKQFATGQAAQLNSQNGTAKRTSAVPNLDYYLLADVLIVILAILVPTPVSAAYKGAIILGLLLVVLARVANAYLKLPTSAQQAIELLVLTLFAATMMAHHPAKWPTPWLLLVLLLATGLMVWLWRRSAELQGTFLAYAIVLSILLWQTIELVTVNGAWWSWATLLAVIGIVLVKAMGAAHYLIERSLTTISPTATTIPSATRQTAVANRGHKGRARQMFYKLEAAIQRLAAGIRLPGFARGVVQISPFLILLYQWLLVISIWGQGLIDILRRIGTQL